MITVASKKLAQRFLEVYWAVFGFLWRSLGSREGDPHPGFEDGVGRRQKIGLCVDLESVYLILIT